MSSNEKNFHFLDGLPGAELVIQGLSDLEQGCESKYTLLLLIAGHRLRNLGICIPELTHVEIFEHKLYGLLEEEYGSAAHSNYNSLIRRIVSFARALALQSRTGRE